jgi:hypothetical protein
MAEISEYIDEDMAVAIAMESTGMSYRELEETPEKVINARSLLRHIIKENRDTK